MSALLRQGARKIGGSVFQRTQAAVTSPAAAEERRRLVARRMYSTNEGKKRGLKDLSDQVGPTLDDVSWRNFPYVKYTLRAGLLLTLASACDFPGYFGLRK